MIEPPALTGALEGDPVELVLPEDEEPLLHAAAVEIASTAAPARQAVRTDVSRDLTAFTYS
jgi:hypothetical protein